MDSNISFSCSETYNVTGNTYDVESPDGGILENLCINFAIWLVRQAILVKHAIFFCELMFEKDDLRKMCIYIYRA